MRSCPSAQQRAQAIDVSSIDVVVRVLRLAKLLPADQRRVVGRLGIDREQQLLEGLTDAERAELARLLRRLLAEVGDRVGVSGV